MVQVDVKYYEESAVCEIITKINGVVNPNIVLWYIGANGLRKSSITFYRQLIAPIYAGNPSAKFWLYDLTAWGALKNPNLSTSKRSRHVSKISNIDSNRINCITSSDIFNKMSTIKNQKIIKYLENALSRKFVWKSSLKFAQSGILIKALFGNNCPVLEKYYQYDTNYGYSMLQYLEGCLLVDNIVSIVRQTSEQKCIQLFFILPNDEIKYYKDETNAFKQDIEFIINHLHGTLMKNLAIKIHFLPFKYGELVHQRPYHGPDRLMASDKLQDIHLMLDEKNEKKILIDKLVQIHLSPIKIETQRLIIQPYQNRDFENSVILYGDNEITKYFDFGVPRMRDEVKDLINHYNSVSERTKYFGLFSIFEKDTMHFVGHIDCVQYDASNALEIGFILHKQYQKRKLSIEILNAFIYAYIPAIKDKISKYKIKEITATAHPENKASIRLLENVGMRFNGTLTRFNNQPRLRYAIGIES